MTVEVHFQPWTFERKNASVAAAVQSQAHSSVSQQLRSVRRKCENYGPLDRAVPLLQRDHTAIVRKLLKQSELARASLLLRRGILRSLHHLRTLELLLESLPAVYEEGRVSRRGRNRGRTRASKKGVPATDRERVYSVAGEDDLNEQGLDEDFGGAEQNQAYLSSL